MRRSTRFIVSALAVPALALTVAGPAMAEDCFNASRSLQGDSSAAAGSGTWWSVPEFLSVVVRLDPAQVAKVMPVVDNDPRVPAGFTVFFNAHHPGELATSAPSSVVTDGHGIDHSDDYSTPVMTAIFQDVAVALHGV